MSKLVSILAVTAISSLACNGPSCVESDSFYHIGVENFSKNSKIDLHGVKDFGKDRAYGVSLGHTFYGDTYFTEASARIGLGKDKSGLEPGEHVEKMKLWEAGFKFGPSFKLNESVSIHPYTGIHYGETRYTQKTSAVSLGQKSVDKTGYIPVGFRVRFVSDGFSFSPSIEYGKSIRSKSFTKEYNSENSINFKTNYHIYKGAISIGYKAIEFSPYLKYEKGKMKNAYISSNGVGRKLSGGHIKTREIGAKISYLF